VLLIASRLPHLLLISVLSESSSRRPRLWHKLHPSREDDREKRPLESSVCLAHFEKGPCQICPKARHCHLCAFLPASYFRQATLSTSRPQPAGVAFLAAQRGQIEPYQYAGAPSWRAPVPHRPHRSINFFEIRRAASPSPNLFTDLPGYGYAKISREVSQDWARFVTPTSNSATLAVASSSSMLYSPQESDGSCSNSWPPDNGAHPRRNQVRPHVGERPVADIRKLSQSTPISLIAFSAKTGSGKRKSGNRFSTVREVRAVDSRGLKVCPDSR